MSLDQIELWSLLSPSLDILIRHLFVNTSSLSTFHQFLLFFRLLPLNFWTERRKEKSGGLSLIFFYINNETIIIIFLSEKQLLLINYDWSINLFPSWFPLIIMVPSSSIPSFKILILFKILENKYGGGSRWI